MASKETEQHTVLLALILLSIGFLNFSHLPVQAQNSSNAFPPSTNISFTSSSQFLIPASNGTVSFESGGSYTNATLNGNVWNFSGLYSGSGSSALPNVFGVGFSVSVVNSNISITHLDALNVIPPFPGQLDYRVTGLGRQAFNLHYGDLRLLNLTVYIDGEAMAMDNGWIISPDGWINVTGATSNVSIDWAEVSPISFLSSTAFSIPALNSSIDFSSGGTYLGEPILANNAWSFQNLALDDSVQRGTPLWLFTISAQNCDVKIGRYNPEAFEGSINGSAWLNYTVTGTGSQTVNLGYNPDANGNLGPYVYIDGENRTQGDGWLIQTDGTITIAGASSSVSIVYPPNATLFDMPPPIASGNTQTISNNILIISLPIAIFVVIAIVILFMKRKHS